MKHNQSTTQEFIEKAIKVHGNKYDYSKVKYINNYTKVMIVCPKHGNFWISPNHHLRYKGCKICGYIKISNLRSKTLYQFIEKAIEIHGNKYDYSKVKYNNSQEKVTVICYEHGEFDQIPNNHLRGKGCPKCKFNKISNLKRNTLEKFIKRSRNIHGDKYNYSKVNYVNKQTKVTIICPIHGEFNQRPHNHVKGKQGCPKCSSSKGELALEEIFKKHNIKYEPQYNIPEIVAKYEIDFYLPEYRLLVEFHGIQHYEYIPFFHDSDYSFEDQKTRDDMVRDAATRWKYNYLELNYKQFKELTSEQFEELVIKEINKRKNPNGDSGGRF